jgi:hypothetical protein
MLFPYERYALLTESLTIRYPAGEEEYARWILQKMERAGSLLSSLFERSFPEIELLLVRPEDWSLVPCDEGEQNEYPHPFWTAVTSPPTIVVPLEVDAIFGELTQVKLAFMLYHELALAFLEDDPRPWPEDYPLWADEWALNFAALWLTYRLDGQRGAVSSDLFGEYADIFEPEPDGKTPVTIRGFDWYEDTSAEDYLCYALLLEQFAVDLLTRYQPTILPQFLNLFRVERKTVLSDDVTDMLASVLGPGASDWLENLVYF